MTDEALEALGKLFAERRRELGYRYRSQFADDARLSDRLVADVEVGRREVSDASYSVIEKALGWRTGAIRDFLSKGERPALAKADPPSMDDLPVDYMTVSARLLPSGQLQFEGTSVVRDDYGVSSQLVLTFVPGGGDPRIGNADVGIVLSEAHNQLVEFIEQAGGQAGPVPASPEAPLSVVADTVDVDIAAHDDEHGEQSALEEQGESEEP